MPSPHELLAAFEAVSGRARSVLVARLLEEKSPEDVARGLGTSVEAADVMLFRALHELEGALSSPRRVPPPAESLPDGEERAAAWALGRALDRGDEAMRGTWMERRFALARAVRAAPQLKEALVLPPPPPPTLRERGRQLLWLALVIAAAVLYSRWTAR